MKLTLNGEPHELADGLTVAGLLTQLAIDGPVAVELNQLVCPKRRHDQTILNEGDVVELVTIVGGG